MAPNGTETKSAFARRVGLSNQRISQLVAEGLPVTPDGRFVVIDAALAWIAETLDPMRRSAAKEDGDDGAPDSLQETRRRLLLVQIARAQLTFEREQGRLLDAAEVRRTVFARARAERDAALGWVQRVSPLLAAELGADPRATFAALDREMRRHLEEMAETPIEDLLDADAE